MRSGMVTTRVHCLGFSHHHTPVQTLEHLMFSVADLKALLARDRDGSPPESQLFRSISEIVLLTTCNRIELYACVDAEAEESRVLLFDLLLEACREARAKAGWESADETGGTTREAVEDVAYFHSGDDAVRHLCAVACGLDSKVLGETQILTQIHTAQCRAIEAATAGAVLDNVFYGARRAGKLARKQTAISRNPASVSSVAVSLAGNLLGDLSQRRALVVGLGEMGEQAVKLLVDRGVGGLALANRSIDRARDIAFHLEHKADLKCRAFSLDSLREALIDPDVVITATGASEAVIGPDLVRDVTSRRDGRELVLLDIAVPRDVDPEVADIDGVRVFDADDLQSSLDEMVELRRQEIPKVEAIIAQELKSVKVRLRKLRIKPLISELRRKAESIRKQELERTYRLLRESDTETRSHMDHLSRALINKLFHEPTLRMEEEAVLGDSDNYASTVRRLFGLKETRDG